jgi:hypothetical protein
MVASIAVQADLFDLAGGTVEFARGLTEAQCVTVAATAIEVQKRLERGDQTKLERSWCLLKRGKNREIAAENDGADEDN